MMKTLHVFPFRVRVDLCVMARKEWLQNWNLAAKSSLLSYSRKSFLMESLTSLQNRQSVYSWSCRQRVEKVKVQGAHNKFPNFFVWVLLLIVHTWNSSPLRSHLLRLQCTCCTVPTITGKPHGSPLVWPCQWPSSQPLLSPHLCHNDSR